MFEGFTFDPSPRSPSLGSENSTMTRETSRSVSPCTEQSPFPRPAFTVTDLAAQFGSQRLRQDSQICYDACDSYANNDDDEAGWTLPPVSEGDMAISLHQRQQYAATATSSSSSTFAHYSSGRSGHSSRPHSPSRRVARQISTRMLCSGQQTKDISALVSRLVEQDQCNIIHNGAALSSPPTAEDEGYDSGDSPSHSRRSSVMTLSSSRPRLDYRRASDLKTSGGCISKAVRLRRDKTVSFLSSRKRSSERQ